MVFVEAIFGGFIGFLYTFFSNYFKHQVIQFVTFSSPIVGGHDSPLKGSLNHPKKVTKNCQALRGLIS